MYSKLISGTAISQSVAALSILAVAQLYSPSEFGIYSGLIASATIISVVLNLKLDVSITMSADYQQSDHKKNCAATIVLFIGAILLTPAIIAAIVTQSTAFILVILLSVGISLTSIFQVFLIKTNRYEVLNKSKFLLVLSQLVVQIIFSQIPLSNSLSLGHLIAIIISLFYISKKMELKLCKPSTVMIFVKANQKVIKFTLPAALLSTVSIQIIPLILLLQFGSHFAGQYAMAYRLLGFPLSLFGAAIGQGLSKEISDAPDAIKTHVTRIVRKISIISSIIFPLFIILGYFIFNTQKSQWGTAAMLIIIMSPSFILNIITSPLSNIPALIHKNEFSLYFTILEITIKPASLFIGYFFGDLQAAFALSSSTAVLLLYYYLYISYLCKITIQRSLALISSSLLVASTTFLLSLVHIITE